MVLMFLLLILNFYTVHRELKDGGFRVSMKGEFSIFSGRKAKLSGACSRQVPGALWEPAPSSNCTASVEIKAGPFRVVLSLFSDG